MRRVKFFELKFLIYPRKRFFQQNHFSLFIRGSGSIHTKIAQKSRNTATLRMTVQFFLHVGLPKNVLWEVPCFLVEQKKFCSQLSKAIHHVGLGAAKNGRRYDSKVIESYLYKTKSYNPVQ